MNGLCLVFEDDRHSIAFMHQTAMQSQLVEKNVKRFVLDYESLIFELALKVMRGMETQKNAIDAMTSIFSSFIEKTELKTKLNNHNGNLAQKLTRKI